MMQLSLAIPMIPVAKQRARAVRRGDGGIGTYTPVKTVNAEKMVRDSWIELHGNTAASWPPLAGLRLTVVAYVVRPPSIPKKRLLPSKRPDLDNYLKTVMDGLNHWAYVDDALLTDVRIKKRYTPSPSTLHGGPGLVIMLEEDTDE